jgi:transposase
LERVVTTVLRARGIAVRVVNPRQVRDFAKATGQLAKTDSREAIVSVSQRQRARAGLVE